MLGAGSSWAQNMRAYSSGISDTNSNISYDSSSKTWSWTTTSANQLTIFSFTAGTLSKFSTINWTSSSSTIDSGVKYRILFYAGNTNLGGVTPYSDGTKNIELAKINKDGSSSTYLTAEELATVTAIKFSGSNSSTGSTVVDLDGIYLEANHGIGTSDDWNTLSTVVNAGLTKVNVSMTDNVSVTDGTMVGLSWDKSYKGTFDGAGHTLTFNYNTASQSRIAPFKYIEGATIKNLLTSGEISTDNLIAGIAADVKGTNYITCCGSDMTLTAANTSDCRVGGLVARCNETGATINFDYCIYNGAISAGKSGGANGFVGYVGQPITVHYSLLAPTSVTNGGNNFGNYNASSNYDNSYYATKFGTSGQGTDATATGYFNSGAITYSLNTGNTGTLFFGQDNLNRSNVGTPILTADATKKVYKLTPAEVSTATYVNSQGAVPNPVRYGALAWSWSGDGTVCTQLPEITEDKTDKLYKVYGKYVLNVSSAGATTLVLPFDAELPSGVTAYNISYTSGADEVTATPVSKMITANQPVLINAAEGTYTFTVSNSKEIDWSEATVSNGALTGVYVQRGKSGDYNPIAYVPANSYVLQNGDEGLGFYKVKAENTIKITSFRAYLTAQSGPTAPALLSINFEDENATAISNVERNNKEDDAIYTLTGIKVEQPTSGIYIKNGKKYYVK